MTTEIHLNKYKIEVLLRRSLSDEEYKEILSSALIKLLKEKEQSNE